MTIQSRYENCLGDMITLLQQAIFRYITGLEVDISKFFQYFKQFQRNLVSLEDNFHSSKARFSKYLSKLHALTQQIQYQKKQRAISLEPEEKTFSKSKSKEINQTSTLTKQPSNAVERTQQLNVIGEIQERQDFDDIRFRVKQGQFFEDQPIKVNRVGTADGNRHKMSVTIDFHNTRPYTGSYVRSTTKKSSQKVLGQQTKERYRSLTKYSKNEENSQFQEPSVQTQKKMFNIGQRKSIYDVLEQEKKGKKDLVTCQEQFLKNGGLIKLPEKKKSWSRWSFKINKLL